LTGPNAPVLKLGNVNKSEYNKNENIAITVNNDNNLNNDNRIVKKMNRTITIMKKK